MSNEMTYEEFRSKMRDEYEYLSNAVFNLCFTKAWSDGHANGYHEVETCLADVVDFANELFHVNN